MVQASHTYRLRLAKRGYCGLSRCNEIPRDKTRWRPRLESSPFPAFTVTLSVDLFSVEPQEYNSGTKFALSQKETACVAPSDSG